MARTKIPSKNAADAGNAPNPGNGGIAGSGIFGGISSGVVCPADDNSTYCVLTKFVSAIMQIIILIVIVYFIYYLLKTYVFKSNTSTATIGGRSMYLKH